LTEDDIQVIRGSDDPFKAAMELVENGDATLLEFDKNSIKALSRKIKSEMSLSDASQVGGWRVVYNSMLVRPEGLARRSHLYYDDGALIVVGSIQSEPVQSVLDTLEELRIVMEDRKELGEDMLLEEE
jgi:hypothetical protein